MRVNRLLEITTLLLQRKTIPAREFAERFNVSVRTIYRDVEELSSAGVPVYMLKGNGGGISLLDTFTLDRALVSLREIDSLLLALKTLQATHFPEVDLVLAKLKTLFQNTAPDDWVHIDFTPWGSKPNAENIFNTIKHAILHHRLICFDYIDAQGEKRRRQVEPVQVIFKSHAWYVRGYCRDRLAFRTFRLSRIRNLKMSVETFERRSPPGEESEERSDPAKPLVVFRLHFSPAVTYRVYDDFSDELITRLADGACEVTVGLVEDEWVYGFLLSYGCYVRVLEPVHIQKILVERMQKAIQQYEP